MLQVLHSQSEPHEYVSDFEEVEQMTQQQFASVAGQYFIKANVKIAPDALEELVFRCGLDLSKFLISSILFLLTSAEIRLDNLSVL